MRKQLSPRTYQYTYYSSVQQNINQPKPASDYLKSYNLPETSTSFNSDLPSQKVVGSIYDTGNYKNPVHKLSTEDNTYPYKNPVHKLIEIPVNKVQTTTPIKFPYKNPGCGLSITGSTSFKTQGSQVVIKMDKITNTRKDGKTGTLRLQLVRMCYFYDGKSGLRPDEYSVVGTANLGQLEFGWSFNDIVRVMDRIVDQQYKYRNCFILLLEQYNDNKFEIVDYVNFD